MVLGSLRAAESQLIDALPIRGVAAHRGGAATHPENTLAAFENAAALGVHQIEFDVRLTADREIVVIHDASVDRTTNGKGRVARLTSTQLRALDAGSWKDPAFADATIPSLAEVLDALPRDVWINLQIKKDEPVAAAVARLVVECGRVEQTFVSCGNAAARIVRQVAPGIGICNLARQRTREKYVDHTIATGSDFIQLHHLRGAPEPVLVSRLRSAGLRINYFCDPAGEDLEPLFAAGVDFALVDDLTDALAQASRAGISPLRRR